MYGRFSLYSSFSEIEKYFELREGQDFSFSPSYNIAPAGDNRKKEL
jgi:putative SOS response-associated peptidase YedK